MGINGVFGDSFARETGLNQEWAIELRRLIIAFTTTTLTARLLSFALGEQVVMASRDPAVEKCDDSERVYPVTWIVCASALGVVVALVAFFIFVIGYDRHGEDRTRTAQSTSSTLTTPTKGDPWWSADTPVTDEEMEELIRKAGKSAPAPGTE